MLLLTLCRSRVISFAAVMLVSTLAACGPILGQPGSAQSGEVRPQDLAETGRVYALVGDTNGLDLLAQAAENLGYRSGRGERLSGLGLWMVPVDLPANTTGAQAIDLLEAAVPGATVGVNHAYRLQITDATGGGHRAFANTLIGWPNQVCRAQRRIGLIDGGVDATAAGLKDVAVTRKQFVARSHQEGLRHGTEVAAVLADRSRLSDVRLYSANVVEVGQSGGPLAGAAQLVQALDWLAGQGVEVVSISLAGPYNKLLELAVSTAANKGMTIVAAVGNSGPQAAPQYPAALDAVVAVTAIDARERVYRSAVQGDHVDLAAVGVDVFVPSATGGRFVTGTSVAAPMVAASLAAQNQLDVSALFQSARDLGRSGKDRVFGHGLLQATNVCTR